MNAFKGIIIAWQYKIYATKNVCSIWKKNIAQLKKTEFLNNKLGGNSRKKSSYNRMI